MKCRRNLRTLFAEYNAASAADKPNTELMILKRGILALKNPATHPSLLIGRPDVAASIANDIAGGMLGPGSTLASRYDDFVWAHHQVMMLGPNDPSGPNLAHRGPAFGPWHRELLKLYEQELQNAVGDPNLALPYWDWTQDQSVADPGFPFTADFLGGDGAGNPNDKVTTGDFSQAAGWTLNCDEEGFGYLRRHFGGDGPGLPTPTSIRDALNITPYDSSPWNWSSPTAGSFRNTLEGWVGPRQIHNAVHRWVDGSMQPGTSPNDPVFFLHHCNIDRLWAVWEQKHPGVAPYLPDSATPAANGLTRLTEKMSTFGRSSADRYFGVDVRPADVVNSKAITWYDSDLPDLSNETGPTLAFTDVPEGLTTYKAVTFRVTGGRPVQFRITGAPSGAFGLTSMGTEFVANPDPNAAFYYGHVWVQLVAAAGAMAPSSLDIHAYIRDQEGYYASTVGGEYPLGDFHVTLTATTVPRQNNSVALVLDRSGSMADPAGGSSTKNWLLKNAVSVFNSLMLPADEIALVSFDDQVATPAPMQAVSAAAVPPVLAGTDLDPRGLTWIGGGIQQGAIELGLASHSNKSMLVLTDGVENVHPYVGELPAGTVTSRTYAIGFGLPADISTEVLQQITSNTHGDLIITGDLSSDEQRFNLTKYFVQVLAGATNMNVILDPQGVLFHGSRQEIPFDVTDADVYIDIIALTPIPQLLDFSLKTPAGTIINPALGDPNVQFIAREEVAFYRVTLPALAADPTGSHAGRWTAVLGLTDRKTASALLRQDRTTRTVGSPLSERGVPYSLVAHAYSNLQFNARLRQDSLKPGTSITLEAVLTEYDVPFTGSAGAWAEVTAPDQSRFSVSLPPTTQARYTGTFIAALPGVYTCRVRAEGYFASKDKFTREKTLTAVSSYSTDGTGSNGGGHGRGGDCDCSQWLRCLTSSEVLNERVIEKLRELGVDIDALRKCLAEHNYGRQEHQPSTTVKPVKEPLSIAAEPAAKQLPHPPIPPVAMTGMAEAASTMPRIVHMHTPLDELATDVHSTMRTSGSAFPRIIRMFSRGDEAAPPADPPM